MQAMKQMRGTFGAIWVNNEKWMDIESFEAKANAEYEDQHIAEDLATYKRFNGWNGEGTIVVKKVYSRGARLISSMFETGIVPDVSIVGKLDDPDSHGAERVAFDNVTFNELTILSFEQKTLAEEELSFNFPKFRYIDMV